MIRNMMPVLNILYIHKHINVKFPNQHDLLHSFTFLLLYRVGWSKHWAQVTLLTDALWIRVLDLVCASVHLCMCVCNFLAAFSMKPELKFELWACDEQTHACLSVCVTLSFSLTQRKPIHTCPHTLMWWQGIVAGMCQDWMIAKHTWGTVLTKGKHSHIWVLNSISLVGCVRQRPHWGTWDRPCLQLYWTGAGSSAGAPPSKASASSHCL